MVRLLLYGYATRRLQFAQDSIRARSMTWLSVIFPATSIPTTPPSPSSASVIWMRYRVCSPRPCCERPASWTGEAWPCGHRRNQDQGLCQQAQGDELQAYERDRGAPEAGDRCAAGGGRTDRCRRGRAARQGSARRRVAIELQRRESPLQKIREAKAALEQEAKEKAEQQRADRAEAGEREQEERRTGKRSVAASRKRPIPSRPSQKAQRNATRDPESRIMPDGANKGSFVQGYNAQIAVDSASQVT